MTIYQMLQGRFVTISMLNDTGDVLAEGSVCYVSDGEFKLTSSEGLAGKPLVVIPDEIPDGENGRGILIGHAVKVNLEAPGAVDDYIISSATPGLAKAVAAEQTGVFGCLLTAGAAPEAVLWGHPGSAIAHDHDDRYYTEAELQAGTGEVHWDNLTNVPDATVYQVAAFSLAGTLQTFAGSLRITNNFGISKTLDLVHLAVKDAPTGATIIVDIHKDGTTIFTNQANRPVIADGANEGETITIDVDDWADGEYLTLEIDQVGSTAPGGYLVVEVIFH